MKRLELRAQPLRGPWLRVGEAPDRACCALAAAATPVNTVKAWGGARAVIGVPYGLKRTPKQSPHTLLRELFDSKGNQLINAYKLALGGRAKTRNGYAQL